MKTVTIEFTWPQLSDLILAINTYAILQFDVKVVAWDDYSRAYLIGKFYEKLLKRQLSAITNGNKITRIKFDTTHAILMVHVLRKVPATLTTTMILAELGPHVPSQFLKP